MSPQNIVLAGGGEMGRLAREYDWRSTPLGPVGSWPQSLRTAASICLNSRFPMLVWWGPDLTQIYNDGYRHVLGDKHPRSLGQPGDECWAEIWDVVGPLYERVRDTGSPTWSEDLLLHVERAGYREETYFTFSYSPILDEVGAVGGVLVTCMETTERVLTERRMRTLRDVAAAPSGAGSRMAACAAIAASLEHNPLDLPFALIYLLDTDGPVLRLAGASGLGPDANPSRVVGLEEEEPWQIARAVRDGEAQVVRVPADLRISSPHEGPVAEAIVLPFSTLGHEGPAGVFVAGVNPGRALDEAHLAFFRLIADQIAGRVSAADAYETERERAEQLAALDRAKTTFFSNVSHEFRTPLTLLLGPIENLLDDGDNVLTEEAREALESAERNAVRLLKLVNTLLDFSRIEDGGLEAQRRPVDLASFTRSLAGVFESAMEAADLLYTVEVDALDHHVRVDPDMWEKIVLNLISNAFKYTPEGRVDVRQRAEGDRIVLEVTDTGVGIEADQVPHLFERFYRASGPWARSQEGTGIGLAVAKELTELHGGTISVETTAGEGSRFAVSIPIDEGPAEGVEERPDPGETSHIAEAFAGEAINWLVPGPAEAPRASALGEPTASNPAEPATRARERGRTAEVPEILVADDNADMRRYLERLLGQRYTVRLVADGASALREARRRPPDLVLADVMMPGLDGFELLAELRADPELRSLPIVLLSARAGEQASVEGIEAGADDYLAKPFTARELLARVGTNIALARARDEAREAERQAREQAEEAVNARARFMANTSHELRTPLNAVMAYLELLLTGAAGDIPAAQRAHLERIRSGAEHLKQIIEEILTFARLEAGTERGVLREVDLAEAVRDMTNLIRPLMDGKGLTLTLEAPERARPVRTDVAKVRQILLNLLSNAYKYTEKGGVTVRLEQAPDDAVTLAVSDTGPGIEAANRDRIFDAFWRGPSSESGGGTGLGLNVARTLARLLGGDITLASAETGSTFTLALPADPDKQSADVGGDGP